MGKDSSTADDAGQMDFVKKRLQLCTSQLRFCDAGIWQPLRCTWGPGAILHVQLCTAALVHILHNLLTRHTHRAVREPAAQPLLIFVSVSKLCFHSILWGHDSCYIAQQTLLEGLCRKFLWQAVYCDIQTP